MPEVSLEVLPRLRAFEVESGKKLYWGGTYTEGGVYIESIANGVTDQLMNMVGVTTARLVVVSPQDGTLTVKINSSVGTAIVLNGSGCLVLAGAAVTAIYLSNSSGAAVKVIMMITD